ncbi:hypothetical protein FHK92_04040 [Pseudomonas brassicacearum subsp. neoaurantiaca]|uniref:Uncharacterized protein n=1 Tax=Pseudomonas brassicacearum subsp. neoaurantiaca TaxID=494916 RepID=A0A7V8RJM9_9PSED|nr:hypothetical protein [Pseudomonas brassicacearum subsp. neoaurantiaca]
MKARISAWRGVSFSISIALSFYTVTGIIYSERRLAIILFQQAARRLAWPLGQAWLQPVQGVVK